MAFPNSRGAHRPGFLLGHTVRIEALEDRRLLSVVYVDPNAPTPLPFRDGSSWASAYATLEDAEIATGVPGAATEIRVADGTYLPSLLQAFRLRQGLSILGGYAGYGAANPDARDVVAYPTILSGDLGIAGDSTDNSYHVVQSIDNDATAVLDGFTITGGNASFSDTSSGSGSGGGMLCQGGSPTIRNCVFSGNRADQYGGGMACEGSGPTLTNCMFVGNTAGSAALSGYGAGISVLTSSPKLIGCTLSGNSASGSGGGMFCFGSSTPTLVDCAIGGNLAQNGGGIFFTSPGTVTRCTFTANSATSGDGGGIYNTASLSTFTDCTFTRNLAGGGGVGGGMYIASSSPTLMHCTFVQNAAGAGGGLDNNDASPTLAACVFNGNRTTVGGGGGMFSFQSSFPTLTNCVFSGNASTRGGGGNYNSTSASPTLINCTFSGNSAGTVGGAIVNDSASATLVNCVIWGNTASSGGASIFNSLSSPQVTYTDVQGGYAGAGNLDADPLFVRSPARGADNAWGTADDDYGDLNLRPGSPGIDAGNNAAVTSAKDLAGNARVIDFPGVRDPGAVVDLGAYEYAPSLTAAGSVSLDSSTKTLEIVFSRNILVTSLTIEDLALRNTTANQLIGATSFAYDQNLHTAHWSFAGPLIDGDYQASIAGGSVIDPSGDPVSEVVINFFILTGDANHDRSVDFLDLAALAQNYNTSGGKTFAQGDFNYDGKVDFLDLALLAQRYNTMLAGPGAAAPAPLAIASLASDSAASLVSSPSVTIAPPPPAATKSAKPKPKPIFNTQTPIKLPPKPLPKKAVARISGILMR
jgi:parallel beta-helix repeat protein